MKSILAITVATLYGLTIRILFGFLDDFMGVMSISFIFLLPFLIGFLTVYLYPKNKINNASAAFFAPFLTSLVILVITIAFSIEGIICWFMIYPVFAVFAGIGGVIAHSYLEKKKNRSFRNGDDHKSPNTLKVSFLLFVPIIAGLLEGQNTLMPQEMTISRSVVIDANTSKVWEKLIHINKIQESERSNGISSMIGFPKHLVTEINTATVGGKRWATYEKGLQFEEVITEYENEKIMKLAVKTDPSKISAKVLDEHIVIGGKYVDIFEDTYVLEKQSDGKSKLKLTSKFKINTPFNWYTEIWANFLMADVLQSELDLVKRRATQ